MNVRVSSRVEGVLALALVLIGVRGATAEASRCLAFTEQLPQTETEPAIGDGIATARALIAADSDDAGAYGRLGMLLEASTRFEAAAACYAEAVERAPDHFRWLYLLGSAQSSAGQHHDAAANLERAVAIKPAYAPAGLRLAAELLLAGRPLQSLETAKKVSAADPMLPQAHYAIGRALAEAGRLQIALESFDRACELMPHYAAAHYARAQTLRRLGDNAAARKAVGRYQQLRGLPPAELDDPLRAIDETLTNGVRSHIARGSSAARSRQFDTAVRAFEAALDLNPALVVAHSNLIIVYGEIDQIENARKHYETALKVDPGWAEAHYNWGAILAKQGRLKEAGRTFRKAIDLDPHYADARVQLGLTLESQKRFDQAAAQYRLALESNPLHAQAHYRLGHSLLREGRVEEGLEELERAAGEDEDARLAQLEALAEAHERDGNTRAALWYARRGRRIAAKFAQSEMVARFEERIRRLEGVE